MLELSIIIREVFVRCYPCQPWPWWSFNMWLALGDTRYLDTADTTGIGIGSRYLLVSALFDTDTFWENQMKRWQFCTKIQPISITFQQIYISWVLQHFTFLESKTFHIFWSQFSSKGFATLFLDFHFKFTCWYRKYRSIDDTFGYRYRYRQSIPKAGIAHPYHLSYHITTSLL